VAIIDRSSRVGRSQGASIFWGLVSVCFAAAACFYYLKNHDNERSANQMRDQVLELREENESLQSQKEHLQETQEEAENQLKTREDLVSEKETELAAEESRLDGLAQQPQNQPDQNASQAAMVKKFNNLIQKLGKDSNPDVVERGGRPVLRVPNAQLFALGDATLTPDGKALLNQIASALGNDLDNFELRVVTYTDTEAEAQQDDAHPTPIGSNTKTGPYASWDLTAARATTIARFYRDQTQLPFLNVLVIPRGDSEPISSNTGENHARNRRVEITITPLPAAFHAPDADSAKADADSTDTPAPAKKAKTKEKKVDKTTSTVH